MPESPQLMLYTPLKNNMKPNFYSTARFARREYLLLIDATSCYSRV